MSTDLPVSESGKSGPARDFEIETKKKEKTVKVVKEKKGKKERKPSKAKERRPKERRPKERRPKERRPKEVGEADEADERLHAVAQRQPTQGGVGHKVSGGEEAVRNRKARVRRQRRKRSVLQS
ncbi:hypothetical protein CesoFtcFv8_006746 [Champsocephalus esox]|uniref:Uncharacterized protein n=1 Tax=Champsocephalus esox TaxID=159716 RepID=A0AAN8CN07_9TELE|nr:hypothetical protein CesoFtcFv8_006746 [Champsocephalus esox]